MSKQEYIEDLLKEYDAQDIYLYEDGIAALKMGKALGIHTIGVRTDYNKRLLGEGEYERVLDQTSN